MKKDTKREFIAIIAILVIAAILLILGVKTVEKRSSINLKPLLNNVKAMTFQETNRKIDKKKLEFLEEDEIPVEPQTEETSEEITTETEHYKIGSFEWYRSLSEVEQLARIIFAEAGGESEMVQKMAGTVVMNRVAHHAFKESTIATVVYAAGQYEPTWSGTIVNTPSETSYRVARWLLAGNRQFGPDVVWQGPKQGYNCVYIGHMWFGTYSRSSTDLDEYKKTETTKPTESEKTTETAEPEKTTAPTEPTETTDTTETMELEETTEG